MKNIIATVLTIALLGQLPSAQAQTGSMPIPQVDTAELDVTIETVPAAGGEPTQYIYRYSVTNPTTSIDDYYQFSLDVSAAEPAFRRPTLQTVPKQGGAVTIPFDDEVDMFFPFVNGYEGQEVVLIGLECPLGWNGGLLRNATVACYATNDAPTIAPGETMTGFVVHSRLPPMLREVDNKAFWTVVVDDLEEEIGEVDTVAAFHILQNLRRPQISLGPGFAFPTDREHFKILVRDLVEMVGLGWIPNATLADELATIVEDAGELYMIGQGVAAKLRLDDVISALANSTDADILPRAATFLSVNVESIQEFGRNGFPSGGLDTRLRYEPGHTELRVGETYDIEVFAFRLNNDDFRTGEVEEPNLNSIVYFGCDNNAPVDPGVDPCPNVPLADLPSPNNRTPVPVDENGLANFSFVGSLPGRDHLVLCLDSSCEGILGRPIVDWIDPPDLVVQAFSPPIILAETGELITFSDRTANIGTGSSGPSTTAYFISDSEIVDPATAVFIGDRDVPALLPGEVSVVDNIEFPLPAGFAMGMHNLIACADDEEIVPEADELNNCSNIKLRGFEFATIPVFDFEDLFVVTLNDITVTEGDSGTTEATIQFDLSQSNPDADISFDYSIVDGTATLADNDYAGTDGNIIFPAGSGGSATQQISVSVVGDTNVEDDETVAIVLTPLSGDAIYRQLIATVTIENDDDVVSIPNVQVGGGSIVEGDEGTQAIEFAVSIDQSDPANAVTVDVSTVEISATADVDYESTLGTVVFPAGTTQLSQSVFVNVFGDFLVEDDETFSVQLMNVSTNAAISVGSAVGTIEDDDLVAVTIGDVSEFEGNSGLVNFNFSVSIDQTDPTDPVSVDLQTIGGAAQAGSDYNELLSQLLFPANTSSLTQFVTVEVIGDTSVEPDENFTLAINSVSANATVLDGEGIGLILNDDLPPTLDCTTATASPNALWPPNHKLVTIDIAGVFGLDLSEANIVVTSIEQDEAVDGEGDGNTSPDGLGVGTDSPEVRRERSGLGDGRIYFINFDATDSSSAAMCSGQVAVSVPHDQGQGSTAIDSGVRFDSTEP